MTAKILTYETFMPMLRAAQHAAEATYGRNWRLVEGASIWARFPARWVNCQILTGGRGAELRGKSRGKTFKGRRDHRIPAPWFWPNGLPVGADYAQDYLWHCDDAEQRAA